MINSKVRLKIIDIFQGSSVLKYYNEFLATLTLSRTDIIKYQTNKLKDLLNYSYNNVPYYKKVLGRNFKANSEDLREIFRQIPPLNRELLQSNLNDLISNNFNKALLKKSSSSGTTGIPIEYYYNNDSLSAGTAAGYFAYSLSGWHFGFKNLHIWGNPQSVIHWKKISSKYKRLLKNQTNIASTDFNNLAKYKKLYNEIRRHNFTSIDGYTTAIFELASFIKQRCLPPLEAKFVFTTAENLLDSQKEIIEESIGQVSDLYGCGEINGIAIRPIAQDKYYIIDPHVFVEVEASKAHFKRVFITDLDNKVMPLIRYQVGDLIDDVYEPNDADKFQFSYFRKILGRESDIIELSNGKKILPVNIVGGTLFRKIGGILKHKIVWNGLELIFYFQTNHEFDIDRAKKLIQNEFLEYNIITKIEIVEQLLPNANGKFKYFEILG